MFACMNQQESEACQTVETQRSLMSIAQFKAMMAECRGYLLLGLSPDTTPADG